MRRLRPERAIVLGGTAAVSDAVVEDLEELRVARVERADGPDRFATAVAVAERVTRQAANGTVYVVKGADASPERGWPDAVAVASSAAGRRRPVLLVTTEALPDATRAFLEEHDVERAVLVGGPAAVSADVETEIAALVPQVERIAGADRYATSRRVAERALDEGAWASPTWFATGTGWPDALAAGPAAAAQGGALLLSPPQDPDPARAWVAARGCPDVALAGGTAALSAEVERALRDELGSC